MDRSPYRDDRNSLRSYDDDLSQDTNVGVSSNYDVHYDRSHVGTRARRSDVSLCGHFDGLAGHFSLSQKAEREGKSRLMNSVLDYGEVCEARGTLPVARKTLLGLILLVALSISVNVVRAQEITLSRSSGAMTPGILAPMELTKISITIPMMVGINPMTVFDFSCSGQPSGVDVQFDPNPLNVPWDGVPHTTVMSATTQYSTPIGVYDLTINIFNHENHALAHQEHFQLSITGIPGFDLPSILTGLGLGALAIMVIHRHKRKPSRVLSP